MCKMGVSAFVNLLLLLCSVHLFYARINNNSNELENTVNSLMCQIQCLDGDELEETTTNRTKCNCNNIDIDLHLIDTTDIVNTNNIDLYCRSEEMLVLHWSHVKNKTSPTLYVLKISFSNDTESMIFKTEDNKYNVTNLNPDTEYQVQLWAVNKFAYSFQGELSTSTLPIDIILNPITNMKNSTDLVFNNKTKYYQTSIEWEPNEDKTCFYEYLLIPENNGDYIHKKIPIDKLYTLYLDFLQYETNYTLSIISKSQIKEIESPKSWFPIMTPTCLETFNDGDFCPPEIPTGLRAWESNCKTTSEQTHLEDVCLYDLHVEWNTPNHSPLFYKLELFASTAQSSEIIYYTENVTGNHSSAVFTDVYLYTNCEIILTAFTSAGSKSSSFPIFIDNFDRAIVQKGYDVVGNIWLILLCSFIIAVLFGIIIITISLYYRRKKLKRDSMRCKYFEDLEKNAPKEKFDMIKNIIDGSNVWVTDDFEIDRDKVILEKILGEGAFGIVRKGYLFPCRQEVAVKTLKENSSYEDLRSFQQEINMMKSVGSHPHLVSMIGCCTKDTMPLLIVEYCELGDLQSYLRRCWYQIHNMQVTQNKDCLKYYDHILFDSGIEKAHCMNAPDIIINKTYGMVDVENGDCNSIITPTDLLSFSRQIAIGMEYLSSIRIIHRDLAARNVLITNDKKLKIADFGLSRDIYQENLYKKTSGGKLPMKWMALESLTHQIYTTQSDVWSFGILLWEIVTLGGNPYPSTATSRLVKLLKSGYRMECPLNCSQKFYLLMLSCWNGRPKERPSFSELREILDEMLEASVPSEYLTLDDFSIISSYVNENIELYKNSITCSDKYIEPI